VLVIFFVAEFVRSSIGFGNALVAMPLLVFFMDLRTATPLFALVALVGSGTILLTSWRTVHFGDAWRLIAGSLLGVPAGLWVLNNVPNTVGTAILAVLISGYGLYSLLTPTLPYLKREALAFPLGLLAGVTGAAFNVAGPPVVIYGDLRRWEPTLFRSTIQAFFIPSSVMSIAGHGLSGMWTAKIWWMWLMAAPVALVAMWLGGLVNARLPHAAFRKVVNVFLIVIGVFMLVRL